MYLTGIEFNVFKYFSNVILIFIINLEINYNGDGYCWMQHKLPLKSAAGENSIKTRLISTGESINGFDRLDSIIIGLDQPLDFQVESIRKFKDMGVYYNVLNGGIYSKLERPIEYVKRCGPKDVVEWEITSPGPEQSPGPKMAQLKINGNAKGKPVVLEEHDEWYLTLSIGSAKAQLEAGYHEIEYPEEGKKKF